MSRRLAWVLAVIQAILAIRVTARLIRTSRGERIEPETVSGGHRVAAIVPVLNEADRIVPCLAGLQYQGPGVAEILIVDGGSTDGTAGIVRDWSRKDRRIRLVTAGPAPEGTNGKVHNLQMGLASADPAIAWIWTVDADVRPQRGLAHALLAFAASRNIGALSVATRQRLSGRTEALLHPAMLTTLVYRFGIPGSATTDPARVQANGQCMLLRRDVLAAVGGFAPLASEIVEDVALARRIAAAGFRVGFYEAGDLVAVEMYGSLVDAWRNWTRSLPMRDAQWGWAGPLGLVEVLFIQALPLPLLLILATKGAGGSMLGRLNTILVLIRGGVLVGTGRAYLERPSTYWMSPLSDLPVALAVSFQALRKRHIWRGRTMIRGGSQ